MTRAALCLAALAGCSATAFGQPTMTYTLSWIEVYSHTSTLPIPSPNGIVEPGESARIRLTTTIAPGVGSTATYTPPPGPGTGTVGGLYFVLFDLLQTNALGGTWSNITRASSFALGTPYGGVDPDGTLRAGQAGQWPSQFLHSGNPVPNIWQGTWNPSTYAPRTASFQSAGALVANGAHSAIWVQYGPDPENDPRYVGVFVPGIFGNTGPIPIVPAPATLLPLAAAAILARRHRPAAGAPS